MQRTYRFLLQQIDNTLSMLLRHKPCQLGVERIQQPACHYTILRHSSNETVSLHCSSVTQPYDYHTCMNSSGVHASQLLVDLCTTVTLVGYYCSMITCFMASRIAFSGHLLVSLPNTLLSPHETMHKIIHPDLLSQQETMHKIIHPETPHIIEPGPQCRKPAAVSMQPDMAYGSLETLDYNLSPSVQ